MTGNGKFTVQSLTNTSLNEPGRPEITPHYRQDVAFDRWYSVVLRVRFGTDKNAILQVWLDGELVVDRKNIDIGYTTGSQVHWKFGVYRNTHSGTHALQFANMEIGQASLLDRVQDPKAIIP